MDVVLELLGLELVINDDVLHDVADGDEAGKLTIIATNWEVAHLFVGHGVHTGFEIGIKLDPVEIAIHGFANRGMAGGLALQDDAAGVFTFGKKTDELPVFHDSDSPDVLSSHDLECVVGGACGVYGVDGLRGLGAEDVAHCSHSLKTLEVSVFADDAARTVH